MARRVVRDRRVCAIKDWLPPVGICIEDGKTRRPAHSSPRTARPRLSRSRPRASDADHKLLLRLRTSPCRSPLATTIKVTAKGEGVFPSHLAGTYTPDAGK